MKSGGVRTLLLFVAARRWSFLEPLTAEGFSCILEKTLREMDAQFDVVQSTIQKQIYFCWF